MNVTDFESATYCNAAMVGNGEGKSEGHTVG